MAPSKHSKGIGKKDLNLFATTTFHQLLFLLTIAGYKQRNKTSTGNVGYKWPKKQVAVPYTPAYRTTHL
jgi:hypothetical protein